MAYSKLDQLIVRSADEENSAPSSSVYPILSLPLRGTLMYPNESYAVDESATVDTEAS